MDRKQITVKYEAGHSYDKWYEKTDLYCPNCGKQEVWIEDDGGDYYVGESYYCVDCFADFNLPSMYVPEDKENIGDWQKEQVIRGIKTI